MSGLRLEGAVTGNVAEVTSGNELKVSLSNTPANIGGVRLFSENDAASNYLRPPETSVDYRLRVGMDTMLFTDTFNYTVQDTNKWYYANATMTMTLPGTGFLQVGTVQGTAASQGCYLRSFQNFPIVGSAPLALELSFTQATAAMVLNEVFVFGFGGLQANAYSTPTDGVWLELTTSGLKGYLRNNNTTYTTAVLADFSTFVVNQTDDFIIVVGEKEVEFWRNDVLLVEVPVPSGWGQVTMQASQPVFVQKYCTGVVSNTNKILVSDVNVSIMDIQMNKSYSHQQAGAGYSSYIMPSGAATTKQTTNYANNTPPTAAALSNTAALVTGLGGIAAFLPTLTANNDGILFNFLSPTATVNVTGRNLYITGVDVQGVVSVVLAGNASPVIPIYSIAFGQTSVSLATAEAASFASATPHAPKIVPLGIESYGAAAAVGTLGGQGIHVQFPSPIVVRPGENIALICRNAGVVTTSGAITVVAAFNGYWE